MKFSICDFAWTRELKSCAVTEDAVEIVTKPHTDLWQRTYYHFRNDNAPVFSGGFRATRAHNPALHFD